MTLFLIGLGIVLAGGVLAWLLRRFDGVSSIIGTAAVIGGSAVALGDVRAGKFSPTRVFHLDQE